MLAFPPTPPPPSPNVFLLPFRGGDGAVPAERRLRREAAAAAAEEVRRAGRLEQGGAHHPECFQEVRAACDFEIEARYSETWSASG